MAAVIVNRSGRHLLRFPTGWPWADQFTSMLKQLRSLPAPASVEAVARGLTHPRQAERRQPAHYADDFIDAPLATNPPARRLPKVNDRPTSGPQKSIGGSRLRRQTPELISWPVPRRWRGSRTTLAGWDAPASSDRECRASRTRPEPALDSDEVAKIGSGDLRRGIVEPVDQTMRALLETPIALARGTTGWPAWTRSTSSRRANGVSRGSR